MTPPMLPAVTIFQSTLSVRRATKAAEWLGNQTMISIHALREESDVSSNAGSAGGYISIHALREESDQRHFRKRRDGVISIHALREESDVNYLGIDNSTTEFQSTLSVRRATGYRTEYVQVPVFQSTLSVRRATNPQCRMPSLSIFQSTLSVRRATG